MISDDTKGFFAFLATMAIIVTIGAGWGFGMALINSIPGKFLYTALYAAAWFFGCLFAIGEGNLKQGVEWFGPRANAQRRGYERNS